MRHGLRRLGACTGETVAQVSKRLDLERYVERGIKGKVPVDWETKEGPRQLLAQLVADAQRLQAQIGHYFSAPRRHQRSQRRGRPWPLVAGHGARASRPEHRGPGPAGRASTLRDSAPGGAWRAPADRGTCGGAPGVARRVGPAAGGVPPAVVPAATPLGDGRGARPAPLRAARSCVLLGVLPQGQARGLPTHRRPRPRSRSHRPSLHKPLPQGTCPRRNRRWCKPAFS